MIYTFRGLQGLAGSEGGSPASGYGGGSQQWRLKGTLTVYPGWNSSLLPVLLSSLPAGTSSTKFMGRQYQNCILNIITEIIRIEGVSIIIMVTFPGVRFGLCPPVHNPNNSNAGCLVVTCEDFLPSLWDTWVFQFRSVCDTLLGALRDICSFITEEIKGVWWIC